MNFPLITDPYFYAVAIPAVLLLGISKSGFGTGFGSLAVPLMALSVSVPQAAAILIPVLLVEQNVAMALDIASRAYVMEEGRIVAEGQASEMLTRPEIQKAYLGVDLPD